jgi:carbonic anhydrase
MPDAPAFPSRLIDGHRDFLARRMPTERERYRQLAKRGQSPAIMMIGCCDSRVSPEVIFDSHPGELFVVRNIANLVPPFTAEGLCHGVFAALEFAVDVLNVEHIVVLGHAQCGGIRAYAERQPPVAPGSAIERWTSLLAPAAELAGPREADGNYLTRLEQASVSMSLENLLTFPCVRHAAGRGKLSLHGAYFGIANGQLFVRNAAGSWEIVDADLASDAAAE